MAKATQKVETAKAPEKTEMTEGIVVVIRVRPLHKAEVTQRSPWKFSSKTVAPSKAFRPSVPCHSFTYDRVYGMKATTMDIYDAHVKDIINSVLLGINGTVLAYGEAGSGKTFTMRGSPGESGVLVLAVQDLFRKVAEMQDREFLVRISYFQVVNEELVDLLASQNQKPDVHDDGEGGIALVGLREEIVSGAEQALSLLEFADARSLSAPTDTSTRRSGRHSVFQMVIESRLGKEAASMTQATNPVQISVLNLIEIAARNSTVVVNDESSREETTPDQTTPDQNLIALDNVMAKLSIGSQYDRKLLPYSESKLTLLLKPSLGGNTRTCFLCHISPTMVHMDGTVATLTFAAKANRVINCLTVNETSTDRALLKQQTKGTDQLQSMQREDPSEHQMKEVVNRRNAHLMIEMERKLMSIELSRMAPLVCWSGRPISDQQPKQGHFILEENSGFNEDTEMGEHKTSLWTEGYHGHSEEPHQSQEFQGLVVQKKANRLGGLQGCPNVGSKRKRTFSMERVAEKFEQVELLVQSKLARELSSMKAAGVAEGQQLKELRALIEQNDNAIEEILSQQTEECRNLRQRIVELEQEKVEIERKLSGQGNWTSEAAESLQVQLVEETPKQLNGEAPDVKSRETMKRSRHVEREQGSATASQNDESKIVASLQGELEVKGVEFLESLAKQHNEAQSCVSHANDGRKTGFDEMEAQHVPSKRKSGHSKANKVCHKYQSVHSRAEIYNARKEMATAKDTIIALKDERDRLRKELRLVRADADSSRAEEKAEEETQGNPDQQVLAAAVDELKAEVKSTVSVIEAVLELVSESFGALTASFKTIQDGVADLRSLSTNILHLSASLEEARLQLTGLKIGKLATEKELQSMKSELSKLECVVERQSGVLKVLSDNEGMLNELSSMKTAMKEAVSASEVRLSCIHEEYKAKVEKLESECENWKKENQRLEKARANIQLQLESAQAQVHNLTKLADDEKLEKRQTDIKVKADRALPAEVLMVTRAKERLKPEKKNKYAKPKPAVNADAEILQLTASQGENAGLHEEIEKLREKLALSLIEVDELRKEVKEKEKAHTDGMDRIVVTEDKLGKLTAAWEDKVKVAAEQQNRLLCQEKELARLAKLLEETRQREENQQREIVSLRKTSENLAQDLKEMNDLKDNYSKSLDRLLAAETELPGLRKLISTELELKSILEQDSTNLLYKLECSEAEAEALKKSLATAKKEKENSEKELSRVLFELSKAESVVVKVKESLAKEECQRKALGESRQEALDKLIKEQEKSERLDKCNLNLLSKVEKEQEQRDALEKINQSLKRKLTEDEEKRRKEEESLIQKHQKVLKDLSHLESKVMQLTEILAREEQKNSDIQKRHQETVNQLGVEQEERKNLEIKMQELLRNSCIAQEAMSKMQMAHQTVCEKLALSQSDAATLTETLATQVEEKTKQEEGNHNRQEEEINAIEQIDHQSLATKVEKRHESEPSHQDMVQSCDAPQSEAGQQNEGLTHNKYKKKRVEKDDETIESLNTEEEKRTVSTRQNQDALPQVSEEQEERILETRYQALLSQLTASQSEVASLNESLTIEVQESSRLEALHQSVINKLTIERQERSLMEKQTTEALRKYVENGKEREEMKRNHQKVLENLKISEGQVVQLTKTLNSALEEKGKLEKEYQDLLGRVSSLKEEIRELEKVKQEALQRCTREEEKKHGLELTHKDVLAAHEGRVASLTKNLSEQLEEKSGLNNRHQELLLELHSQQQENRTLEKSSKETLDKLARELENKSALESTQHNLLERLSSSEAKVAELVEALSKEVDKKHILEQTHEDSLQDLVKEQQEQLVKMQTAAEDRLSERQKELQLLKESQKKYLNELDGSQRKIAELTEGLDSEIEKNAKKESKPNEVVGNLELLKAEVSKWIQSRARDRETTNNDREWELSNSKGDMATLIARLSEVAEKEKVMTNFKHVATSPNAAGAEIKSFIKMAEDEGMNNEQQSPQLTLDDLESGHLVRETAPTGQSTMKEPRPLQLELDAKIEENDNLTRQSDTMQLENSKLIAKVSCSEMEILRLQDEVRDKLRMEKEHRDAQTHSTVLQAEISNLRVDLDSKLKVEERLQLDILSRDGEISKLTKQLQANRKAAKYQKRLVHKLTCNQAEVLRLTNAFGGRLEPNKILIDTSTATDPAVTGFPCEHYELQYSGRDHKQLQQRLEDLEEEAVKLRNVGLEKTCLEKKCTQLQEQVRMAEAETKGCVALLEDKSKLEEQFKRFQTNLSEAGLLTEDIDGFQYSTGDFSAKLGQIEIKLIEQNKNLESKAAELADKERTLRDKETTSDVDYESLNTIITIRERERDELREQCALVQNKLENLGKEAERQRGTELSDKKLKSNCQKAERDAAELRAKLIKLEEVSSWIARDKGAVEERLACCEGQLAALREASWSTTKELEMSRHQLHVLTSQHQSEIAALCEELSLRKAQKAELEAELKRIVGPPRHPSQPLQDDPTFFPGCHFRTTPWPYSKGPGHH